MSKITLVCIDVVFCRPLCFSSTDRSYTMDREAVHSLVESSSRGVLSTLDPDEGWPYGSIVEHLPLAPDRIVFLLSDLAEHTAHLENDARSSLLIVEDLGEERLLEEPRATLMGRIEPCDGSDPDALREAYLELHPHAEQYIDFEDFRFYMLHVDRLRYIGGFGDMGWLTFDDA